ncbi:MAG: hypothetical protein VYA39_01440 [Candidatus Thermoplasmatota archaeon]|nr:hypothetical protein [Candidatus Thermoplasmatota archaeon]
MSEGAESWRPGALPRIENNETAPRGFEILEFSGRGPLSALSCIMIAPSSLTKELDWAEITSDLSAWGEVPDPSSIEGIKISEDSKGPIAHLRSKTDWVAEFLPWGSDGLLRKRVNSYPQSCDLPCGGYSWNGADIILIRKEEGKTPNSREEISNALENENKDKANDILRECGRRLGTLHSHVEGTRVTPPDPKRWNSRLAGIEEALRAHSIWRVPYSRDSDCMLSIGDVRLDDFRGDAIRIGRPRLSDAMHPIDCGFPAIRDLASLVHDLSRLHYSSGTRIDIIGLRLSLIEGWRETAPSKWSSDNVFYSHRGGLAIWEYEQCLLDVTEATSHQSGAPQPAVGLIEYIPSFQKRTFNNRTVGALSIMSGLFGISTLLGSYPLSMQETVMPSLCFIAALVLMRTYRGMSPPPEIPFNRLG